MRSSNGTRTEFLYEDDPNGNRIIDYKITKPDGKWNDAPATIPLGFVCEWENYNDIKI